MSSNCNKRVATESPNGVTETGLSSITQTASCPSIPSRGWGLGRLWEADRRATGHRSRRTRDTTRPSRRRGRAAVPPVGECGSGQSPSHPKPPVLRPGILHTPTLDVGLVLSGQIVLEMEDGTSAELSPGRRSPSRTPRTAGGIRAVDASSRSS